MPTSDDRPHLATARAVRIAGEGWHGHRWGDLAPDLVRDAVRWFLEGAVEGGEALKEGRVWRVDGHVFKFHGPERGALGVVRPSRAARAARWHFRILPICSPTPRLVLERRRRGRVEDSLLVSDHVAGARLNEVIGRDDVACDAFTSMLSDLHRRRLMHGDLHAKNSLWDGRRWWLLDLDGMRHPLQWVGGGRKLEKQWGRLLYDIGVGPASEALFEEYRLRMGLALPARVTWGAVVAEAREQYPNLPPKPDPDGPA